jgi:hypothetical protein
MLGTPLNPERGEAAVPIHGPRLEGDPGRASQDDIDALFDPD